MAIGKYGLSCTPIYEDKVHFIWRKHPDREAAVASICGRPPDPSQDAAYFAKWIGRRIEGLSEDNNFTADWQRDAVRSQLENAKAVYLRLIRK